jgi:hypothetical protein
MPASYITPAACRSYRVNHPPNLSAAVSSLETSGRRGEHVRSLEEFNEVRRLIATGMNDCAVSRETGIPRTTVRDLRRRPQVLPRYPTGSPGCGIAHDFATVPAAPYSYLLGLYLGDGYISRQRRVWRLRVTCDTQYPAIIARCREAIDALMPKQRAAVVWRQERCVDVSHFSKHWPCLFPQHGRGRKHSRPIRLEPVAGSHRLRGDRRIRPRPDPQRRLPRRRQ